MVEHFLLRYSHVECARILKCVQRDVRTFEPFQRFYGVLQIQGVVRQDNESIRKNPGQVLSFDEL